MDELRGPNIQIILHVKEGLGFGFLRTPFIVSGSLNGYMLETDPVVPAHAPAFDAELVWEADKRKFRSLRVQNVPIKVEVFTMGTQGRKDKVGYLLLSLLGAQPCPSNKVVDTLMMAVQIEFLQTADPAQCSGELSLMLPAQEHVKVQPGSYQCCAVCSHAEHRTVSLKMIIKDPARSPLFIARWFYAVKYTWHRLLGVKSEGKCCHPQLMMSLSVEDRVHTMTPRNELRMFHSNEVAYLSTERSNPPAAKSMLMTYNEYIEESKKTVLAPELQPKLLCEEGLIQIGDGREHCVLSFLIGSVEHLDMLLPENSATNEIDCYVTYSVFTHNIMTDRVRAICAGDTVSAQLNQRTSLRVLCTLAALSRYFAACPLVVATLHTHHTCGICSMDLRKLVPTEDPNAFLNQFCNTPRTLRLHERCFIQKCPATEAGAGATASGERRRPYMDVEMSLQYVGVKETVKPALTARSATQLSSRAPRPALQCSGSAALLNQDTGGTGYTNITAGNTHRYKNASGDAVLQTTEIADLIKKMCDSFTQSQEKLLAKKLTCDMQVQCEQSTQAESGTTPRLADPTAADNDVVDSEPVKLETSKSDTCIHHEKDRVKLAVPLKDRDEIIQKFVDELEDWKEKQQELFKYQLQRKEEYHLELLSREWVKKRQDLESKLSRGIEQCRTLAADLSRATDDFRLRGYRNTEREKKLLDAKKALESHYTAKYQELREASQKMEDDMNHRLKLKDMAIEELNAKITQLEKQVDVLKNNLKNCEKESESKYSGLTKDQTASLIQELRCLEEKFQSAVQAKQFFKEQWGRGVRELHLSKLSQRKQMLQHLHSARTQLSHAGLETIEDCEELSKADVPVDINKLKDDFYVDLLVNTPALDSHSISNSVPEGMDMLDLKKVPKNPTNEKINELISQRDRLIQEDNPDEETLKHLNHEIRNLLLNCGN